ncbi:MAG: beta strand repeat-containing protein [Bacteroidia bacterium]
MVIKSFFTKVKRTKLNKCIWMSILEILSKNNILFYLLISSTIVNAQTPVFSDNFNVSQGSSYSNTSGAIGSSSTWSLAKSGADWGARINPAFLDLTNDVDVITTNTDGWVFGYTSLSNFSAPYNATLSSNAGIVSWSFNLRTNRTTTELAGFNSNTYGIAMVLASTSNTPNTSGSGYAVVMGGGTNNNIGLIYFTGGLQGTKTTVINYGGVTPTSLNNYMSVQISYNPSNNLWTLSSRDDGSSAFADPSTGLLTSVGSGTNSMGTNTAMTYFGAYWQGSTFANQTCFIDNITVSEVVYSNFYSKSTGGLNDLSNWGTNTDGTGTAPLDFTSINQVFNIRNNVLPTIDANWIVSGTNSKIIVGNGTNACNFTIPSNYTVTATIDVANSALLTLQNTVYPTFGTLAAGSTIVYDGATSQTINAGTYANLTIQNSGASKILGGNIVLGNNNTFTLATGVTLTMGANLLSFGTTGNAVINGILQTANTAGFSSAALSSISNLNSPTITIGNTSTIVYNAASTQTITGGTFANIQISNNAAIKNASANITLGANNTFTLDAGVTYNANTFRLNFGTGGTVNINGIFQTANIFGGCFSGTNNSAIVSTNTPTINLNTGSTVEYTSTSPQTISTANSSGDNGSLTYYHLLISGINGTKTFSASPKIAAGGSFTLNENCTADFASTQMDFMGSGCNVNVLGTAITQKTLGGISGSASSVLNSTYNATISYGNNSTIVYNGTGPNQAVAGINYQNLTIAGSNNKNLNGNVTVTGLLTLSNKIVIGAFTLTLNGTFSGSATNSITGSTSSNLVLTGAAKTLYFDQTSSATNLLKNLTISGVNTMTLGNALNITGGDSFGIVTVGSGATLYTGGFLTLKSNATGTASIGNYAGTISGNITVERYIPANGRRYRFLASPVVGGTSLQWRNNGVNTSGLGIQITGSSGTVDASSNNISSAFYYQENNTNNTGINGVGKWAAIDGNTSLTNGLGYRVFVRGDRTISLNTLNSNNNATTISVSGTHATGTVTLPVTYTAGNGGLGWNLVGNPYPCSIDWNASLGWTKTNINDQIAIYRPSTNTYSYFTTTGNVILNNGSNIIGSGQAFWVRATGTSPALTCTQAVKVTTAPPTVLLKSAPSNQLRLTLTQDSANIDETVIAFDEKFQDGFIETEDVNKLVNATVNISSVVGVEKYAAINFTSNNFTEKTIPLSVWGNKNGDYQLDFSQIEGFDPTFTLFLKDKYLKTTTAIDQNKLINFAITNDTLSKGDFRFELLFKNTNTNINDFSNSALNTNLSIYPNPANDLLNISISNANLKNSNIVIYNLSGMEVGILNMNEATAQFNIEGFSNGVYFVKVINQNGFNKTVKFVK